MPRKAKRRKKAKPAQRAEKASKAAPGPVRDSHTVLVACRDCGLPLPECLLSAGYCPRCHNFAIAERDTPGGLPALQKREWYKAVEWERWIPTATCKPRIGLGIGPTHLLNLPVPRLRDILGPPEEENGYEASPYRSGSQGSRGPDMREEFTQATITDAMRRHFTEKEEEAVDLFLEGKSIAKIGRILGVTRKAIAFRLQSALAKIQGRGVEVSMTKEQLEAVENEVVATA